MESDCELGAGAGDRVSSLAEASAITRRTLANADGNCRVRLPGDAGESARITRKRKYGAALPW
jgi:hypothetical protein